MPPALPTWTPAQHALRVAYPIALLLGGNGLAVWLVATGHAHATLIAVVVAAIALSFAVERIIPYQVTWNRPRRDAGRDWAHALVNEALNVAAVAALPAVAWLAPWPGAWPTDWPLALQLGVALVVLDAGVTLTHVASHRVPLLWRFHAVHHSVTRHYGLNGLMKHPIHQAIELAVGVAPLIALGLPGDVAVLLAPATAIQLLLQHSNADYATGPFGRVLALNRGHRFHHLKWAGVGDVNFGLFTNLWDVVLGTWSYDAARRFTSDDLGIADQPRYPTGYAAQLAAPFRRQA